MEIQISITTLNEIIEAVNKALAIQSNATEIIIESKQDDTSYKIILTDKQSKRYTVTNSSIVDATKPIREHKQDILPCGCIDVCKGHKEWKQFPKINDGNGLYDE